jgi:hypothetical protein
MVAEGAAQHDTSQAHEIYKQMMEIKTVLSTECWKKDFLASGQGWSFQLSYIVGTWLGSLVVDVGFNPEHGDHH